MKRRLEPRWAIFISGRGSNLQTVLDGIDDINVIVVVSNSASAPGVAKARRMGVPVFLIGKKIDWDEVHFELKKRRVNRIFLAGFMRLIPGSFVEKWKDQILNVHPSLLPEFPGMNAIENSFGSSSDMGVTVHYVTAEMDAGEVLFQKVALTRNDLDKNKISLDEAKIEISRVEQFLVREAVYHG